MSLAAAKAPAPLLNVIHGTREGFWVRLEGRFSSLAAAQDAIALCRRQYHPSGYGTYFEPIRELAGEFVVKGSRYASCD